MSKSLKKIISTLLLSILFISTMLTGCGKQETESSKEAGTPASQETSQSAKAESDAEEELEPVTLVLYLNQYSGTGDEEIEAAVNALEQVKALNVTLEFKTLPEGDNFQNELDLVLASGEQIDIVMCDESGPYQRRIDSGAYAELSELLKTKYTKLYDTLRQDHWLAVSRGEKIYGVPVYKEATIDYGFGIAHSFVEKYNIDLSNRNMYNIDDILEALVADGRPTFMLSKSSIVWLGNIMFHNSFRHLQMQHACISFENPDKVVSYFATEEFKKLCLKAKEWYDKGLIASDVLTKENYNVEEADESKYGLRLFSHAPYAEVPYSAGQGFQVDYMQLTPTTITLDDPGWVQAIPANSKNIDRALAFLELLATDAEVKNTFTYGVEGVHYDLVNGQVDWTNYPDHNDIWTAANERSGNMLISYPSVGFPEEGFVVYEKAADSARPVPTVGFRVDTSNITNEIAALDALKAEYWAVLCSGTAEDVEATLAEFIRKLEAAGMQKVIDEVQAQWDAFNAAK